MARRDDKVRAIALRKQGASYTMIQTKLKVSKSTLSGWLKDHPLSKKRIGELSWRNERRIERYRATMRKKREVGTALAYGRVSKRISTLSKRDMLIAGLFLYWGEGTKTSKGTLALSNNDPHVLLFFIEWIVQLGYSRDKLRVYVHLYADMDATREIRYWSRILRLPLTQFRKPYIKETKTTDITYKSTYTHGTCNVIAYSSDIHEEVIESLVYLRNYIAKKCPM